MRSNVKDDADICVCCKIKYPKKDLKEVSIKGYPKKICNECVETIHGLV